MNVSPHHCLQGASLPAWPHASQPDRIHYHEECPRAMTWMMSLPLLGLDLPGGRVVVGLALQCPQDAGVINENLPGKCMDKCHHRKNTSWNGALSCSRGLEGPLPPFSRARTGTVRSRKGQCPAGLGTEGFALHSSLPTWAGGGNSGYILCWFL